MPYSIKKKFIFYHSINHNGFLTQVHKTDFNDKFYAIQQVCTGFQKLAHIYKYKKAPIIVDTDICLNKINITDKNVMCIYQNNFKYLFNVLDLIKIANHALTHSESFYSDPKPLKNPYNNMYFSKSNLYNIYFYIKYNTTLHSDLFSKYFDVNFNLTDFNSKYEYILREYSIENYVKNSSINVLFVEALRMFSEYNYSKYNKFRIDANFPREVIVKIMKPYLLLHMQSLHSLVQTKKTHATLILKKKLLALYKFNSNFGKKIMYPETKHGFGKNKIIYKHYFDDKHPPFHKHSNNFLSSHTTLNYMYNDESVVMPQITNAFEYAVYNVEVYAEEIEDEEIEDEETDDEETDYPETDDNETVIVENYVTNNVTNLVTNIVPNLVPNIATNADDNDYDSQNNYQETDDNSIS
jgi:hypothetical protein